MEGFEKQIDRLMELTHYQVKKMQEKPEMFYLLNDQPECVNVIFWYIPTRLRDEKRDHWWQNELGKATAVLKGRMMKSGTMMISYQPFGEYPNFFRSILSNQAITEKDVDFMLEELDRLGHDL